MILKLRNLKKLLITVLLKKVFLFRNVLATEVFPKFV